MTYKKASGGPYVAYGDIVEEALCFGWVDSVPRKLDAERSQLLVTPRKRGSRWSKANKARIERLTAAGLLAPEAPPSSGPRRTERGPRSTPSRP